MTGESFDGVPVIDIAIIPYHQPDLFSGLTEFEYQIELAGKTFLSLVFTYFYFSEILLFQSSIVPEIFQHDHHIEQGASAHIPPKMQELNQFIERVDLVFISTQGHLFDLVQ